jgi:hypothetical protein
LLEGLVNSNPQALVQWIDRLDQVWSEFVNSDPKFSGLDKMSEVLGKRWNTSQPDAANSTASASEKSMTRRLQK